MTTYKITARVTLDFDCEIKATEELLFHWAGENSPCLENYQFALNTSNKHFDQIEEVLEIECIESSMFGSLDLPAMSSNCSVTNLQIRPIED